MTAYGFKRASIRIQNETAYALICALGCGIYTTNYRRNALQILRT